MYEDNLVHKLEVWRRPNNQKDDYGQLKTEHVLDHEEDCRLSFGGNTSAAFRSGEIMTDRYVDVVRDPRIVFCKKGADVTEADMVVVKDKNGDVILPKADVTSVRPRYRRGGLSHVELFIEAYRKSGLSIQGSA